ncbi:MAG: hypothetical protein J5I98_34360 [Phaeodactylibacter sp.]|nr:hypothetical protein [Phaeodactylibacter sp.]
MATRAMLEIQHRERTNPHVKRNIIFLILRYFKYICFNVNVFQSPPFNNMKELHLENLKNGKIKGLSKSIGAFLYEAATVALFLNGHKPGAVLKIEGDYDEANREAEHSKFSDLDCCCRIQHPQSKNGEKWIA